MCSNLDQGEVYNIVWLCDKVRQCLSCDRSVVFSINKTDRHDITEILLKVALNTTKQANKQTKQILGTFSNICRVLTLRENPWDTRRTREEGIFQNTCVLQMFSHNPTSG